MRSPEQWLGIIGLLGLLINQFVDNSNGGKKDIKRRTNSTVYLKSQSIPCLPDHGKTCLRDAVKKSPLTFSSADVEAVPASFRAVQV